MPNTLEGVTALQSDVAQLLRAAGIPEEYVSTILIATQAGEEARQRDIDAIDRLVYCGHGFSARWLCPTCRHFDEIEARERYALQSEQSTGA